MLLAVLFCMFFLSMGADLEGAKATSSESVIFRGLPVGSVGDIHSSVQAHHDVRIKAQVGIESCFAELNSSRRCC